MVPQSHGVRRHLVLPAVLWFLIQIEWLSWNLDYSTLGLLGLGPGILIVLVINGLNPFGRRRRAKVTAAGAASATTDAQQQSTVA
jgi:hypothetical protein